MQKFDGTPCQLNVTFSFIFFRSIKLIKCYFTFFIFAIYFFIVILSVIVTVTIFFFFSFFCFCNLFLKKTISWLIFLSAKGSNDYENLNLKTNASLKNVSAFLNTKSESTNCFNCIGNVNV